MSVIGSNILAGASGAGGGYQISRSVRLRSSASAYFNWTPASATNRRTFTWSGWVKRGASGDGTGSNHFFLFTAGTSTAFCAVDFYQNNIRLNFGNGTYLLVTSAVYRDYSSWYHIVVFVDTTQATNTNRVKLYINGTQVTAFSTAIYPIQNYDTAYNNTVVQRIAFDGASNYFDGYLTEINFIDGQALTPSSFGETNPVTGVWQPKKYAGTYGTNGFFLNFSDNSAATAAAIGKDYSGNGNNWTPNNISVTAGVTYDSMLDVPTQWGDGGNGRGNYCTFNPLVGTHSNTYSNGNLQVATSTANAAFSNQRATFGVSSGKWYWEITCQATSSAFYVIGITADTVNPDTQYIGQGNSYCYRSDTGQKATNGTFSTYGATFTTGDIIGVEFDADAGTLVFYKNNVSQGTAFTSISGTYFPAVSDLDNNTGRNSTFVANFGQRPFSYTPPSGFKALNTLNLPTPTILKGNQYFDAVTYAGSASQQTITTSLTGLDLAWIKNRTAARDHVLVDTVRGGSPLLTLYSDLTAAEDNSSPNYNPTSFTTSGIVLGGAKLGINNAGENFVLWGWKEGATQGFDIVTYTGTGATLNVSHNLGVAPKMIITKSRSAVGGWPVYHASIGATGAVQLESTGATSTTSAYWNNTAPTSTQFTLASGLSVNGTTYVAYLFAEVAGYSAFGSYTGNGSTDGPFVFCGFRPRFFMTKRINGAGDNWHIHDTSRSTYNIAYDDLRPNTSGAENTTSYPMDILSNGIKWRQGGSDGNESGADYIFAAFAENPFKYSLAR